MKSKNMIGDSTKYRLDMVEKLAESPGMCSDCPGTTPKALPLEVFFHVLERSERERVMEERGRFEKEEMCRHR